MHCSEMNNAAGGQGDTLPFRDQSRRMCLWTFSVRLSETKSGGCACGPSVYDFQRPNQEDVPVDLQCTIFRDQIRRMCLWTFSVRFSETKPGGCACGPSVYDFQRPNQEDVPMDPSTSHSVFEAETEDLMG